MAKITEVYMVVDGQQTRFTMNEYISLRENDPHIRALKFIPIDNRMYEATPEQFQEWKREQNRKAYLKTTVPKPTVIPLEATDSDGTQLYEHVPDQDVDVAKEATLNLMLEALRNALLQLSEDERQLIHALFCEGLTEREYAKVIGISQPAVHKRLVKLLGKLRKLFAA